MAAEMQGALGAPTTRTKSYAEEEQRRDPPQIGRQATGEVVRCALGADLREEALAARRAQPEMLGDRGA